MISAQLFRTAIVRPTLHDLDLWSQAAENLLVGTALQESNLQAEKIGPDIAGEKKYGIYQISQATLDTVYRKVYVLYPHLGNLANRFSGTCPSRVRQLVTNLGYATAIARLIYFLKPEALPHEDDIEALARYWKRYFNTPIGRGSVGDFILGYRRQCLPQIVGRDDHKLFTIGPDPSPDSDAEPLRHDKTA